MAAAGADTRVSCYLGVGGDLEGNNLGRRRHFNAKEKSKPAQA
jgi:hypothetical protein